MKENLFKRSDVPENIFLAKIAGIEVVLLVVV
jgi:hypothetical protein